mgnify:FL=1
MYETLILFFFLQVKHWYADFVIQTYMQTVKKGVWLHPVGISHSLEHMASTLAVLLIYSLFFVLDPWIIIMVGASEGVLHYIIDFTKVKYGIKDMTKPLFWNQFGMDQLAHQATYIGMSYLLLTYR